MTFGAVHEDCDVVGFIYSAQIGVLNKDAGWTKRPNDFVPKFRVDIADVLISIKSGLSKGIVPHVLHSSHSAAFKGEALRTCIKEGANYDYIGQQRNEGYKQ